MLNEEGRVVSLLDTVTDYSYFIAELIGALSPYHPKEIPDKSIKIFDVSDLQLVFTEEEDRNLYYQILGRVAASMNEPLICMSTIGSDLSTAVPSLILAEETEMNVGEDVALFNTPYPEKVYDEITKKVSYLVGVGATQYQTRNIIENGSKGPLLSSDEILAPMLEEQEKRR